MFAPVARWSLESVPSHMNEMHHINLLSGHSDVLVRSRATQPLIETMERAMRSSLFQLGEEAGGYRINVETSVYPGWASATFSADGCCLMRMVAARSEGREGALLSLFEPLAGVEESLGIRIPTFSPGLLDLPLSAVMVMPAPSSYTSAYRLLGRSVSALAFALLGRTCSLELDDCLGPFWRN